MFFCFHLKDTAFVLNLKKIVKQFKWAKAESTHLVQKQHADHVPVHTVHQFIFYKSGKNDLLCNSLYNATLQIIKQKEPIQFKIVESSTGPVEATFISSTSHFWFQGRPPAVEPQLLTGGDGASLMFGVWLMVAVGGGRGWVEAEHSWSTAGHNMATGTEEVMDFGEAVFPRTINPGSGEIT